MTTTLYTHLAAAGAALAIGAAGAWQVQAWRHGAELAGVRQQHAQAMQAIADKTAQVRDAVRRYEAQVTAYLADKDTQHFQELTHAQSETRSLRACVAAGTCGVRVITRSTACAAGGAVPQDAGAGGMGDGAIALDGEAAGRVLDLRESVQSDAAKLAYLREYASACYRAGVEGAGVVGGAASNPP